MSPLRKRLKPLLLLPVLGLGACGIISIFQSKPAPTRLFSHKLHVKDQELECNACHGKGDKEDLAGMPASLKKCMLCHEGIDEKKEPDRKLAALLGEKPAWSTFTAMDPDIKFSHKSHVADGKLECAACHAGMEENVSVTPDLHMDMETCTSCHAKSSVPNDCATCHKEIRQDAPPPSHLLNWKLNHGHVARWKDTTKHANDCKLCHAESSCAACHREEAPASHTNFWRLKGHATAAETDRSQCAVCHKEDSCIRCHEETPPASHTAAWGSPQDLHCLSCHLNQATENCAFCHRNGTPSHSEAADKPSWHNSGMNCRQCHGQSQPLPHPDNGGDCNACHK